MIFKLRSIPQSKTQKYVVDLKTSKGKVTLSPCTAISHGQGIFFSLYLLLKGFAGWITYQKWGRLHFKDQRFCIEKDIVHKHPKTLFPYQNSGIDRV